MPMGTGRKGAYGEWGQVNDPGQTPIGTGHRKGDRSEWCLLRQATARQRRLDERLDQRRQWGGQRASGAPFPASRQDANLLNAITGIDVPAYSGMQNH